MASVSLPLYSAKSKNIQLTDPWVDIDWEYPGGNGADYKETPNSAKTSEIEAFPKVLAAIRKTIGPSKILSIAVPGKKIDMIAYTKETGPKIWPSVDYINVSTSKQYPHILDSQEN